MLFDFDVAKVTVDETGGWLCLKVKNLAMARQFVFSMLKRMYTADVKEFRKKRSVDANAKFWKLCGELSVVVGRPPEDIYRDYIKDIGGNYEVVPIKDEAVLRWAQNWASRGIGWVCEILDKSKHPGYTNMISYYGSSTYDTAQMSRLLNFLIEDCKAQGIETLSPDELERLLSLWENQNIA